MGPNERMSERLIDRDELLQMVRTIQHIYRQGRQHRARSDRWQPSPGSCRKSPAGCGRMAGAIGEWRQPLMSAHCLMIARRPRAGSAKTTLAGGLAVAAVSWTARCLDLDPLRILSRWWELRPDSDLAAGCRRQRYPEGH